MADELETELNQPSDSQKRIKSLSDKLVEKDQEKAVEQAGREKAEAEKAELSRERDFYQGFSDVVSTNPMAKDHKDEILAKVKGGYSVEDATYAVLGKAGKLGQPKTESMSAAGGSATTTLPQEGAEKSIGEMTQAERRAELANRVDLVDILAPRGQRNQ